MFLHLLIIFFHSALYPSFGLPTLTEVYKAHDGHVSLKWDNFLYVYEAELLQYRRRTNLRLLEVGVMNGGGLEIWQKYFDPTSEIIGIDIDSNVCEFLQLDDVKLYCFDATSSYGTIQGDFDVIIDDASHSSPDVINTFLLWFKRLSKGGVYIVEDLEHSYKWDSGGGLHRPGSSMKFFQALTDLLNFYSLRSEDQEVFNENYVHLYGKDNILYLVDWVSSVKFIDQMVIVQKKVMKRHELHLIATGRKAPIAPYFGPLNPTQAANFERTKDL